MSLPKKKKELLKNVKTKTSTEDKSLILDTFENDNNWCILGASICDEINFTLNRESLVRKLLKVRYLGRAEIARVKIRDLSDNNYIYPPEFDLKAEIIMEKKDLLNSSSNSSDIIEEKYEEALKQILPTEEKMFLALLDHSHTTEFKYVFTLKKFREIKNKVKNATNCILSYSLWDDLLKDPECVKAFEPTTRYALVTEGILGKLDGITLHCDCFRHPDLQTIPDNTFYILSHPNILGDTLIRADINSIQNTNNTVEKKLWCFVGYESMCIKDLNLVSKAIINRNLK